MEIVEYIPIIQSQPTRSQGKLSVVTVMGLEVESIALFLCGSLPKGVDGKELIWEIIAKVIGEDTRDTISKSNLPLGIIRVMSLCDETPDVKAALVSTIYTRVPFGTRIFVTSPYFELKEPLRSGFLCLIGRRLL